MLNFGRMIDDVYSDPYHLVTTFVVAKKSQGLLLGKFSEAGGHIGGL